MREILFHAKRIDNGEWVEGYYVNCYYPNDHTKTGHFIVSYPGIFYEIYTETLCQYTGLTDKNGKRIWENDILRGHGNDKDLVKVVFGEFNVIDVETEEPVERVVGWHTEVIETDELSKLEPFCLSMPLTDFYIERSEFEVIGNVFDNPDLLKGDAE